MAARGFTMIELLVSLAVAGVLIGIALPAFRDFVEQHRSTAAINQLIGAVQFARHAAVSLRTPVILCPRDPSGGCGGAGDWSRGAFIYADRDRNEQLDATDDPLRELPALPEGSAVYWRSFRNRAYLSFDPSGLTAWQNGTFLYCPPNDDPRFARAIIVNPQGRVRSAKDRNGDGVVEDTRGRPVVCPARPPA